MNKTRSERYLGDWVPVSDTFLDLVDAECLRLVSRDELWRYQAERDAENELAPYERKDILQ